MIDGDRFFCVTVTFEDKITKEVFINYFEIISNLYPKNVGYNERASMEEALNLISKRINTYLRNHPNRRLINVSNGVKT